ncbi:MAG: carboxymuconolactone decarboxylase family protein [Trueperaceae bacterium]|nr:carboxymuconolactone decarboxylase family protein [Trueperaceae bacterium]
MAKPTPFLRLQDDHPELVAAYERFASLAHEAGPLSDRERRLVKLALAIATASEGATHSHARQALEAGIGVDDLRHVAFLAATTAGFPVTMRALSWIQDVTDAD